MRSSLSPPSPFSPLRFAFALLVLLAARAALEVLQCLVPSAFPPASLIAEQVLTGILDAEGSLSYIPDDRATLRELHFPFALMFPKSLLVPVYLRFRREHQRQREWFLATRQGESP